MPRTALQPYRGIVFAVLVAHVAMGTGLWWWWHRADKAPPKEAAPSVAWVSPADFTASSAAPAKPLPPAPKAIAIDPGKALEMMKAQEAGASMPLAAVAPVPPPEPAKPKAPAAPAPASPPVVASAPPAAPAAPEPTAPAPTAETPPEPPASQEPPPLDVARFITISQRAAATDSVRLDDVDRSIIDAFRRNWTPPLADKLNIDQRNALLDAAVDRVGHVLNFKLAKRSGSDNFDLSVLEAADRLDKIDAKLPPSYTRDTYEFQVHFHVE